MTDPKDTPQAVATADAIPKPIAPHSLKPKTFDEAFQQMRMTEEEAKALEAETYQEVKEIDAANDLLTEVAENPHDPNELPEWVEFPAGFKIPPNKEVTFMRFESSWTDYPDKGDRWCMVWPLSDAEEKLAIKRTRGEQGRAFAELAQQCVRLIDGKRATWDPTAPDAILITKFFHEIGGKCRPLLQNYYAKAHSLTREEQARFFLKHFVVRKAVVVG